MPNYIHIPDFVRNDLFGLRKVSDLINGVTYLHDTLLGSPSANSHNVVFADDVRIGLEFLGARTVIPLSSGKFTVAATDGYLYFNRLALLSTLAVSTPAVPFAMARAGSIVGWSAFTNCTSFTSSVTFRMQVRKNEASIFESGDIVKSATGVAHYSGTFARGTHTFAANDRIESYLNVTSAGNTQTILTHAIEVQFDT